MISSSLLKYRSTLFTVLLFAGDMNIVITVRADSLYHLNVPSGSGGKSTL